MWWTMPGVPPWVENGVQPKLERLARSLGTSLIRAAEIWTMPAVLMVRAGVKLGAEYSFDVQTDSPRSK